MNRTNGYIQSKLPVIRTSVDILITLESIRAAAQLARSKSSKRQERDGVKVNVLNRIPAKDNMPCILHNSRDHIIRQGRIQHPAIEAIIVGLGPFMDLVARDSKLRTTRRSHHLGHISIVEQFLPGLGVEGLCVLTRVRRVTAGAGSRAEGLDFVWTAGVSLAAQVGVAVVLHVLETQGADGVHVAVGEGICVPGFGPAVLVAVDEDDSRREIVVVLDDVLQVCQTFTAFIAGGMFSSEGVINRINHISPSDFLVLS